MIIEKEIKIGWKKLKELLEDFRKVLNRNNPLPGHGIFMHDTDKGVLISTIPFTDGGTTAEGPAQTPDGRTAGWHLVNVVNVANGTCVTGTIWYWGTEIQ